MAAIVLAGGSSTRLGRDKALERLGDDNLLKIVVNGMLELSDEVLIVVRPDVPRKFSSHGGHVRVIYDDPPGKGPLGGLASGIAESRDEYSWAVGCDMPFLSKSLLRHMMSLASGYDAVVPNVKGLQPLHAVYGKGCLPAIRSLMENGKAAIHQMFELIKIRYIGEEEATRFDSSGLTFFNVNTEKDLAIAKKKLGLNG